MSQHGRTRHSFRNDDVLQLGGADLNAAISQQVGSQEHVDFSTNITSVMSLPLPTPTDCYEDWIHTELGPRGRWIIRLLRYYRAERTHPWKSKELYVADRDERDEQEVPLATAYGRAWLFSCTTWPPDQAAPDYRLAS